MRSSLFPALILLALALAPAAGGFDLVWTDAFGESSYTIAGPDSVGVGDSLRVTLTAADSIYPEAMIAGPWEFLVDGVTEAGGATLWLTGGQWSAGYAFAFPEAGSHTFTFHAQDHGHGGGMHNWTWFEITGTTLIGEAGPPSDVSEEWPPIPSTTWGAVKDEYRSR
jgi:hypothetical protein